MKTFQEWKAEKELNEVFIAVIKDNININDNILSSNKMIFRVLSMIKPFCLNCVIIITKAWCHLSVICVTK